MQHSKFHQSILYSLQGIIRRNVVVFLREKIFKISVFLLNLLMMVVLDILFSWPYESYFLVYSNRGRIFKPRHIDGIFHLFVIKHNWVNYKAFKVTLLYGTFYTPEEVYTWVNLLERLTAVLFDLNNFENQNKKLLYDFQTKFFFFPFFAFNLHINM